MTASHASRQFKIGAWLAPEHTTVDRLRSAWRALDELPVDSIWVWDHFFPLTGDPDGPHFEGWTLLAALAADTARAEVGMLVTNHEYRNPDLLADMARTVDHISGGRLVLGLGAGWVERDYAEYGYEFRSGRQRAESLADAVQRVSKRLAKLNPPPVRRIPILIGGDGQQVVLRVTAEHADIWNTMAWKFEEGSKVLDQWCERVGRDPAAIERTAFVVKPPAEPEIDTLLAAGATHIIIQLHDPFDLAPVRDLVREAERRHGAARIDD
jgi:probable F420-dependent oxidoreductase